MFPTYQPHIWGAPNPRIYHFFFCSSGWVAISVCGSISFGELLKPWSTHTLQPVGDLLMTIISGGRTEGAGRSQGGPRLVDDRLQRLQEGRKDDLVAMRFRLLQVKPLCDQIDRRKMFGGRKDVGDWSATDLWLVGDWSPTSRRGCRRSHHSF